ncbi:MAG: LAGLIDADG family homing endonuclease [Patescibacteria group bacterium]
MTWEYIAGFFDGEGSITYNGKGYRISIAQTNKEVFDTIMASISCGMIFEVKKRQEHWKQSWVYYIAKQEDVLQFLEKCYPHLIVKKPLARKTIKELCVSIKAAKARRALRAERIKRATILRNNGFTYRAIGKRLHIDFGYARQLILAK